MTRMNRYRIDLSGQTVGLDFDVELYIHADNIKDVGDIFREYDIVRLQVISPDDGDETDVVSRSNRPENLGDCGRHYRRR